MLFWKIATIIRVLQHIINVMLYIGKSIFFYQTIVHHDITTGTVPPYGRGPATRSRPWDSASSSAPPRPQLDAARMRGHQ